MRRHPRGAGRRSNGRLRSGRCFLEAPRAGRRVSRPASRVTDRFQRRCQSKFSNDPAVSASAHEQCIPICAAMSAGWRTDPALSRNPKPPPFTRWRIHASVKNTDQATTGSAGGPRAKGICFRAEARIGGALHSSFQQSRKAAGPCRREATLCYISLSSVIGRSRTRFPVALNTALATAAPTPVMPISPTPRAPTGA